MGNKCFVMALAVFAFGFGTSSALERRHRYG